MALPFGLDIAESGRQRHLSQGDRKAIPVQSFLSSET